MFDCLYGSGNFECLTTYMAGKRWIIDCLNGVLVYVALREIKDKSRTIKKWDNKHHLPGIRCSPWDWQVSLKKETLSAQGWYDALRTLILVKPILNKTYPKRNLKKGTLLSRARMLPYEPTIMKSILKKP